MTYVVRYSRKPLRMPDGSWKTECFLVQDVTSETAETGSAFATRSEATLVAALLNG
jgi:hypothetical protein